MATAVLADALRKPFPGSDTAVLDGIDVARDPHGVRRPASDRRGPGAVTAVQTLEFPSRSCPGCSLLIMAVFAPLSVRRYREMSR